MDQQQVKPLRQLWLRAAVYFSLAAFMGALALLTQDVSVLTCWAFGWLCHSFFCDWEREP